MTGKERILAKLRGEPTDSLPLMPITMMFASDVASVCYGDYARDHRVLADAQVVADRFDFDYVSAISDPAREASDLGVEGMGQTSTDIIDLDFLTPLGHVRRAMRETQVLLGNIDPVQELRDSTPHANLEAMARFARSRS